MDTNYTGFIYLWFDKLEKRYYLGSHYGSVDDGYIGSGVYFKRVYSKRPDTFKRRILETLSGNKIELRNREAEWLSLIKDSEISKKYYNLNKLSSGGSVKGRKLRPLSEEHKKKLRKPRSDETKARMRKPKSAIHRQKITDAIRIRCATEDKSGTNNPMYGKRHSDETKLKIAAKALSIPKETCIFCNRVITVTKMPIHLNAYHLASMSINSV